MKLIFYVGLVFGTCRLSSLTQAILSEDGHKCWNGINDFARICYFADGAINREGKWKYGPDNIDEKLCTHILYAFAVYDELSNKIVPADSKIALDMKFYEKITNLKKKGIRVGLSLGGWGDSTVKYSRMMNDRQRRRKLVTQISAFLIKYGFQGLDVDIEYPCAYQGGKELKRLMHAKLVLDSIAIFLVSVGVFCLQLLDRTVCGKTVFKTILSARNVESAGGMKQDDAILSNFSRKSHLGEIGTGSPEDKQSYVEFLRELRQKFDKDYQARLFEVRPTLSVAVTGKEKFVDPGYDVIGIASVCDWIGIMAYDIHDQEENRTGLVAPFSVQPSDEGKYLEMNVQAYMNLWLRKGAPANKLVVGIPFYGRPYLLANKNENGINAPSLGVPKNSSIEWSFYEIIDNKLNQHWRTVHYNNLGSTAFKEDLWIGYDDKYDIAVKAEYIRLNCFFGGMIWVLDSDCFRSDCPDGAYPLLTTLKQVLTGEKSYKEVENIT